MTSTTPYIADPARFATREEAGVDFNACAFEYLGISGEEFRQNWNHGNYDDLDEPRIDELRLMMPPVLR